MITTLETKNFFISLFVLKMLFEIYVYNIINMTLGSTFNFVDV
jgi:hypothetical protein